MVINLLLLPAEHMLSGNRRGTTIDPFMDVLAPQPGADMQVPSGNCNGLSGCQTAQAPARTLIRIPSMFPILKETLKVILQ